MTLPVPWTDRIGLHSVLLPLLIIIIIVIIIIIIIIISEQRPETLTVDDLKDLRYLECVIKVRVHLVPHTEIPTTLKYNLQ